MSTISIEKSISGKYTVKGVKGFYKSDIINSWNRVKYYEPVGDEFKIIEIARVSSGIYGSEDFDPCPNVRAVEQIENAIKKHASELLK